MMNLIHLLIMSSLLAVFLGCKQVGPQPRPEAVKVSGKIFKSNGSPLTGGTLILRPDAGLYGATAQIQNNGTFTLEDTAGNQNVVSGRYQVFVSFPSQNQSALKKAVNGRYQASEDGDSDIYVEITESQADLIIRLKE